MEVENPTLASFDLQSKPSFSFSLNEGVDSSRVSSEEHLSSERSFASNGDAKAKMIDAKEDGNFEVSVGLCPDGASMGPDAQAYECSESELSIALKSGVESTVNDDSQQREKSESSFPLSSSVELMADNVQMKTNSKSTAALKLQKVYKSYRTRRKLADSAVVAEELWCQAIAFVRLNHSTISFFNFLKPETAASRWNRVSLNASKVGKGLSKDAKAQKLAFQHWIEAIDPRHRYGHNLHLYSEEWCKADAGQPFFFWLDVGHGKEVDLKECPRSKLHQQCIKYLGPQERENYEYTVVEGKIVHKQTGVLLHTSKESEGSKWIFVMSAFHKFYAGMKKKGIFHHSSFLAGGATLAAGRLDAENGVLKSISAYSGHYRPTDENLDGFLAYLKDNGVNLDDVQIHSTEDYDNYEESKSIREVSTSENLIESKPPQLEIPSELVKENPSKTIEVSKTENKGYSRTLSGGLQSPKAEVPKKDILQRINSKKAAKSYQLGHQLSLKWSSGAGPRIGCVADYPLEVRVQALEFVNLSPRVPPTPSSCRLPVSLLSPTARSE